MRLIYMICVLGVSTCIYAHEYELLAPVDTVCETPQYESVCDGMVYIWTKCDVLRAITTYEQDRQAFSQLIVADVMHVANYMLKLLRGDDVLSDEQWSHLYALTQHVTKAYNDAFADSSNTSIACTQKILGLLQTKFADTNEQT